MPFPAFGHSWPKAILHLDGDAFFASIEQAVHPEYKGKPVITGKERGIVAAASYEAKKFGVQRGVPLHDVLKMCPGAIIVPSDYETYSLFSKRMFAIMRRFTPEVEEYSIDEGFADITGLRRAYHTSYEEIAKGMKAAVESELGITVSVGLSVSKVLAKVGSKHQKPAGFTAIPMSKIHECLSTLSVGKLWGIGPATSEYCHKLHILTALDFARKSEQFILSHFTKPTHEIWQEINGSAVYPVTTVEKTDYASISKTKTFTPPSDNQTYVLAQLAKNLENACIKSRRHHLVARRLSVYLKTQEYHYVGLEAHLTRASSYPLDILPILKQLFEQLYRPKTPYRATGVVLSGLTPEGSIQANLFEPILKIEKVQRIYHAVDQLAEKFGKHTVYLGASSSAQRTPQHVKERGDIPDRKENRLKGETSRQHLTIPLLLYKLM